MSSEHTNFIRNSRKFLHCGECGRPFDTVDFKPRVLGCGHNVCELCMNSQRLSMGSKCCMVCASTEEASAPVSHDLLGIVFGKEQAMKRVPLKYRCGECTTLYRENDMTVCRTCSGWSEGMQTEEATDFAKRPISSLICWICAGHHRHANHDKMSLDIINRIWDTPIAMEFIETQLGTAEKLLDLLRGGAITQINQLADCFSVKLEEFKLKIRNGQFPLDSTTHITKAVDVISAQIRRWNLGIQKSSEDAHLLIEYFETLLKHVVETPQRSGSGKWEQPTRPTTEPEVHEDIKMVIRKNIRELQTALPISEELKLSQSPEVVDRVQRPSETTTNATTEETPTRKRVLPPVEPESQPQQQQQQQKQHQHQQLQQHQQHQQFVPFFSPDDYLDRPRRVNTKKNYAIEDDVEPEVAPRKRGRKKAEVPGDDNGLSGMNGNGGLSPYNMSGTHLANDPLLAQSTSSVSPVRRAPTYRRGRGKRRGFRGGRGSRGGYRHLAVPMSNPVLEDPANELEAHHQMQHNHADHLYDNDLHVDPMHDPLRSSFDVDSDQDRMQSHETPPVTEPTTEQLFQELTGIGSSTSGAVSSCGASGGGGQPGDGHGPSPPPLSQNSSPPPPFVGQSHKTIMPVDFLGQTDGPRQLGSPYGDGLGHQMQQTWEDLNQDAQFGCGPMADYYHCAPVNMDATSFVNNTPPY